jgi:uncharacterized protein YegL
MPKKKNRVFDVVIIADRSGSMGEGGILPEAINGYNEFVKQQHDQPGETKVTTVLFDDRYEVLYDRVPLAAVAEMTREVYVPRGNTALLDAIGKTIATFDERFAKSRAKSEKIDEDVIVCIITDGFENASREFSNEQVKALIAEREKMGWEFIYLAANANAFTRQAIATYGINQLGTKMGSTISMDSVQDSYRAAVSMTASYRDSKMSAKPMVAKTDEGPVG